MTDILGEDATDFYQQHFRELRHSGAHVAAKVFEECDFTQCSFNGARFERCKFIDCTFRSCDLSNLDVTSSKFLTVLFEECKIIGVDWNKAEWPRFAGPGQMAFKKSVLSDSSFFGMKLPELVLEECKARSVDFRGGDFSRANFTYSDLAESMFGNTLLSGADFREATNYSIDIRDNQLNGAKFTRHEAIRLLDGLGFELFD
ncbi:MULTISPECIES: pentapeptide repeat-containing protein [Dyella]|uniref:Pentapeptide repeat-containing protein n=2 Tax=Dyella TaxID=231454 RepID=A0A4R0YX72_9GAMM|nr:MULTISPECIES: pentapeptide repeat-containing protein [Dyella]TBR40564.1 pentapeptide repeat-containing protein [Dyella terrae]TCI11854.1 pentapeptide repeat-containing protein [Dyella soli]